MGGDDSVHVEALKDSGPELDVHVLPIADHVPSSQQPGLELGEEASCHSCTTPVAGRGKVASSGDLSENQLKSGSSLVRGDASICFSLSVLGCRLSSSDGGVAWTGAGRGWSVLVPGSGNSSSVAVEVPERRSGMGLNSSARK